MTIRDNVAELLEHRGLWRRAARRWLIVMDESPDEIARERIASRRRHCLDMAARMTPVMRRVLMRKCQTFKDDAS